MAEISNHASAALAHLSNALDDLQYSPDQRPVPLINEAMAHLQEIQQSAASVVEAVPNEDGGLEIALRHHIFIYEVDFGDEGKGRYIRLRDFNAVVEKLESIGQAQANAASVPVLSEAFVVRMLDYQPLTGRNLGNRLWQFLEAGGIQDGEQIQALLGAMRYAMRDPSWPQSLEANHG